MKPHAEPARKDEAPAASPPVEARGAPDQGPAVLTRGLVKVYRAGWRRRGLRALNGLDLRVERGEVFGLLGPNGSGKSTAIKLLLGLLFPTSGDVEVLGGSPRDVKLKARIGYLPEESFFYPHLTCRETLDFASRIFRIARSERDERSTRLLRLVGLEAASDRPVAELSKGMLRRIGLAQALVNDPDLLILDEPTSGMDPIGTREVKALLRDLKRRGKTTILSSHLLADVEDVCDRVAILHAGEVKAIGPVRALLADDERTQIVTGKLSPATLDALISLLKEREGGSLAVSVGAPSTRLEDFFLRVVSEGKTPSAEA